MIFGVGTKPKKLTNGGARFSVNIVFFKLAHCIFERVLGVVGYFFIKKIQIFMEKRAPQNGCFFHTFCDVYWYPCVQCGLEPVCSACNFVLVLFLLTV